MFGFYLRLIVYLSLISMTTGAGQWASRPGTLDLCEGEDAELGWHYLEDGSTRAEMIFWMEMNGGDTMIAWYADNNSTKVYPDYAGRVSLLPGTNAGIVLRNVTEADGRQYNIEVAGPGLRDAAYVNVFTDARLVPILQVDNAAIDVTSRLNKTDAQQSTITVSTRENKQADITIKTEDTILAKCQQVEVCSAVVSFSDFTEDNLTTTIHVNYGVCQPHDLAFVIYTGQEKISEISPSSSGTATVVIITTIIITILVLIAVVVGLWFVFRERQLRNKPLADRQVVYVNLPFLYRPFTQFKRWRSVEGDPENAVELNPLTDDHFLKPEMDSEQSEKSDFNEVSSKKEPENQNFIQKFVNKLTSKKELKVIPTSVNEEEYDKVTDEDVEQAKAAEKDSTEPGSISTTGRSKNNHVVQPDIHTEPIVNLSEGTSNEEPQKESKGVLDTIKNIIMKPKSSKGTESLAEEKNDKHPDEDVELANAAEEDQTEQETSDATIMDKSPVADVSKDNTKNQTVHVQIGKKPSDEEKERRRKEAKDKAKEVKKKKDGSQTKTTNGEGLEFPQPGGLSDEKPSDGSSVDPLRADINTDDPKTSMTSSDPMQRHESSKSPATDPEDRPYMTYRSPRDIDQDSDDDDKESVHDSEMSDEEDRKTKDYVGALKDKDTNKLVDMFYAI